MGLWDKFKNFTNGHDPHHEIVQAKEDLNELDENARQDEILRKRLNARLAALSAELDNLTRRGGTPV